ncbi:MAG: hypothetical protein ACR2ND_15405 [Solirubrobacteraceae bacterium]
MAEHQRTLRPLQLDASFDEFVASGSARLLRSAYLLTLTEAIPRIYFRSRW